MVAFSLVESAASWVESCGFEFPLVVDTNRSLFGCLGLRRSVLGVWNVPSLIGYAEELREGRELFRSLEGDDLHQMGGDFMVDSSGTLVYSYRGKTSSDRPSVGEILTKLKQLRNDSREKQ